MPILSSTGRVAPGFCVKGEGGYVVAPPSIHPDGSIYRWLNDAPIVEAPAWLVALARKPRTHEEPSQALDTPKSFSGPPGAYGAAALRREIAILASTPKGRRNHQANKSSFSLHQLVAGRELDRGEVEQRLVDACIANGLVADDGLRQCLATIRSGARAGS